MKDNQLKTATRMMEIGCVLSISLQMYLFVRMMTGAYEPTRYMMGVYMIALPGFMILLCQANNLMDRSSKLTHDVMETLDKTFKLMLEYKDRLEKKRDELYIKWETSQEAIES